MKQAAGCLCATFTLFGLCAPAFAQAAAPGSNLQAGGLKPPEAVQSGATPTPTTTSQTEAQLDRADKEDSGRGLEFVWLNAEVGPEYLGLQTFKANGLVDAQLARSKQAGLVYGAGLGVRLLVFTLGARFRLGNFSDYQLWTLNGELGMHIPLGRIEPYVTFGGGYASLGSFDTANIGSNLKGAHGLDVRGGFGLDLYLTNSFSVGGNLTGDVLFLSRAGTPNTASPSASPDQQNAAAVYAQDGSSIGAGATLSAVLGLHF